jgi:hypothetical protein
MGKHSEKKTDYEPLSLSEQKASFRNDPVKLDMSDGTSDPINDSVDEHPEPYVPKHGA